GRADLLARRDRPHGPAPRPAEVSDDDLFALRPTIQARGYLTKDDLEAVRQWKWPPSKGRSSKADPAFVEAATGVALSTPNEQLRIEGLMLIDCVGWPVASVVLPFFHTDRYP